MKVRFVCGWIAVAALAAAALARSQVVARPAPASDRDRLIGAWRLVSLEAPGPDGKISGVPGLTGALLYTRDGHMSVQVMYPPSAADLSNDYVLNGYEASFGTWTVDEHTHVITHHVEGSVTRALIGRSLARAYRFSPDGRLVITSTRPDEHWSATWEHE